MTPIEKDVLNRRSIKMKLNTTALSFMLIAVLATVGSANVINVPGDYSTIQAGLNATSFGDTVQVAAGTYVENIVWPNVDGIKLFGAGQEVSIIDGNNTASVLRFESTGITNVTIVRGFTLMNGYALPPWPDSEGGGIFLGNSGPIIEYVTVRNNSSFAFGAGIAAYDATPGAIVRYCLIANNTAIAHAGVNCSGGSTLFDHVTVAANSSDGMFFVGGGSNRIENSIVAFNTNYDLELDGTSTVPTTVYLDHSDILSGWELIGNSSVSHMGPILHFDPLFFDMDAEDYHLLPGSPCIDSGNPSYALDPDNTTSDMGAFFFDQLGTQGMSVDLVYVTGSPVPASGGNLIFDLQIENSGEFLTSYDAWLDVSYMGGDPTTLIQRAFSNYASGRVITRPGLSFTIPATYAAGDYTMYGRIGYNPDIIWDEASFPFSKEGTNFVAGFVPYAVNGTPDPFDRVDKGAATVEAPSTYSLEGTYPNPFNPTTTIHYVIPEAAKVTLTIYDIQGREVAELVNGFRQAGSHEVTFDASQLTSGVYLYRLSAPSFTAIGKMTLLK